MSTAAATAEKQKPCRDFAQVAVQLASRWSAKRLRTAAQVIVDALREHGRMNRQEVRNAARLTIGGTGLLDFVLKSIDDCVVDGEVVRRVSNPKTRVLEFSLEEVLCDDSAAAAAATEEPRSDEEVAWPSPEPLRDFAQVAVQLAGRWSAERLRTAAQVIVDALREHGGMTRQEVRDAARLTIGDTGLLDFVIKSVGDCVVDGQVVRRVSNPKTRVLEFSLEEVLPCDDPAAAAAAAAAAEEEPRSDEEVAWPSPEQVERDVQGVYRSIVVGREEAARTVLDSKAWGGLGDRAALGEPRKEAERALRDTAMEGIEGDDRDPVLLGGAESGSDVDSMLARMQAQLEEKDREIVDLNAKMEQVLAMRQTARHAYIR